MDKVDISSQLGAKYNEIFPQYWSILMKLKEEPSNTKYQEIYNYLNSNIKYLESYMSLISIKDKDEMKQRLETNNFIKELTDALYEPREPSQLHPNPKVEMIKESSIENNLSNLNID